MSPILTARISEGLKAEIETLVGDTGLWASRTDFVREALDEKIRKYWNGDRYAQNSNPIEDNERR
jgi:Arc/MetJ-type ribon-helix-helix transcriptional regulator